MRNRTSEIVSIPRTGNASRKQREPLQLLPGGIRARLFVLITLALLPILILLGWIYNQRYETRRIQAMQTEVEVARGIATTFATYVHSIHKQNYLVGQAILTSRLEDQQEIISLLAKMSDESPAIRNVSWVAPDGIVQASSLPALVGQDLSVRSYYREILDGKRWAIGDLTSRGIVSGGPTLGVASAIFDEQDTLRGIVVAGLEPQRFSEVALTQKRPADGTYAIFDRQGVLVYNSTDDLLPWEERTSWTEKDAVLRQVLETGQEQVGIIDLEPVEGKWITARVPIDGIGFIAGARRPEEVALAPIRHSLYNSALTAVLVWLMAFLFALLVSRTISVPLHRLEQDARSMGSGTIVHYHDLMAPTEVHQLRRTVEAMASALIHRAEELRESETRFRVLFHNRHTPMLLIDPATRQIVDANPAASAFYGWSQDALRGMSITEINQLANEQVRDEIMDAAEVSASKRYHFRHRLASGEIRDVEVSSGPIQVKDQQYLLSIIQDVTERKQAERELQKHSEGLALLSEAARELLRGSEPISLLDRIYPRLSDLLGLDAYLHFNVIGEEPYLHLARMAGIPEQHRARISRFRIGESICGRTAKNREPAVFPDVQQSQDPQTALIRELGFTAYVCHPLIVQDQLVGTLSFGSRTRTAFDLQAVSLMSTTADLLAAAIHRRKDETTLQEYASKLEESNHELQQFAFIASHDLQEPLRKVETFGSLLLKDGSNLETTQREYLERMQQATNRMRQMVKDLLELSRVNTQGRPFEPVNLNETAQGVLSDLEIQVKRTQGKVELGALPAVQGDPTQMRQLLQNLIGNSLKYHRPDMPPLVKVTGKQVSPARVEIRVEDNGIGFEQEYADRIFQPFQRLVGRSEYEGSGMGLAICRKIVERHNGSITAESTPGQGATFIVRLPVEETIN